MPLVRSQWHHKKVDSTCPPSKSSFLSFVIKLSLTEFIVGHDIFTCPDFVNHFTSDRFSTARIRTVIRQSRQIGLQHRNARFMYFLSRQGQTVCMARLFSKEFSLIRMIHPSYHAAKGWQLSSKHCQFIFKHQGFEHKNRTLSSPVTQLYSKMSPKKAW